MRTTFARFAAVVGLVLGIAGGPVLAVAQGVSGPAPSVPNLTVTGTLTVAGSQTFSQKCDSSASPGNATCNQAAGQAAIAATAATITITNSLVATTSIVTAVLQFSDATCVAVKSVVPGAGSFTINTAANCTSNTKVGWVISSK